MSAVSYLAMGMIVVGLAVSATLALTTEPESWQEVKEAPPPAMLAPSPLPEIDPSTAAAILERSPFASDRNRFERGSVASIDVAGIDVRVTGLSSRAGQWRANIVVAGQAITVGIGDVTPAGTVALIDERGVVFEGIPERRFDIFKR